MKKLMSAIAIMATLGFTSALQAQTLAEILLSDGDVFDRDQNDFDIVTHAILACSDLAGPASDEDASLTVFLPADKVFRILVEDVYDVSIRNEAVLFGAIAANLGCATIESVLKYDIVPGEYFAIDVAGLEDATSVTTLLGATFTVDFRGKGQIRLGDNEPALRDPIIRVTHIVADNGVAHVIDHVLLPFGIVAP